MFDLPKSLDVNGVEYPIKSDFRDVLKILVMFEADDLTKYEKAQFMSEMLYLQMPPDDEEAMRQAAWFIDGGAPESSGRGKNLGRLYSWEQDKVYIFSGTDKALGFSSRSREYLHWWEFFGAMLDMGECAFSHIIHMRRAKKENKLTKDEQRQWRENPDMYELRCGQQQTMDILDFINS